MTDATERFSEYRIRYSDDQIMDVLDLREGQKYVIVCSENTLANKIKSTQSPIKRNDIRLCRNLIEVIEVGSGNGGRFVRYNLLNEYLKVVRQSSDYLTDIGIEAYKYSGGNTWVKGNYVRKLRSTDYINDTTLKTASRLLMLPWMTQKNIKRA